MNDQPRLVLVEWTDSTYISDEIEETAMPEPIAVRTCGHLVREHAEYVSVALTVFEGGTMRQVTAIPRVAITRLMRLIVPKEI